jgi:hypothetical protein
MSALGRHGGLRGGLARARALPRSQRVAIARQAARARWNKPLLVIDRCPRDHDELVAFVAHYGTRVARATARCSLENVALQALQASRRDPALARMLPVFLWRVRRKLDLEKLAARAARAGAAAALGYFLELTGQLGSGAGFDDAVATLRAHARPGRPAYFFDEIARNPFEAMAADERTPAEARAWGLLTGTPTESFATHFRKTAHL